MQAAPARYTFFTPGKLRKPWSGQAAAEYLARLNPRPGAAIVAVKARGPVSESSALLEASRDCYRIALDRRGSAHSSRGWADELRELAAGGVRRVGFLIGGADGHDAELLGRADASWSLGGITLAHELAVVVALEQLYRAHSILANSPYHRD